jgi:hypothetical protein
MSYRFAVPGGAPDPGLLRAASAHARPLEPGDASGVIAWRGRTTRGVYVYEREGSAHFKLPTMASPDDVRLAMELAIRHAVARGVPIDVEDPPSESGYSEATAPAPPPGTDGLFWVRPEELERWPRNWYTPHGLAGAMSTLQVVKTGGAVVLSGPYRRSFMGMRMFRESLGPNERGQEEVYAHLCELLANAQREDDATLPVMPRFVGGNVIGQQGFFAKLFGKSSLPLPSGARWSPPSNPTLEPARALEGDLITYTAQRRSDAHHTVAHPGVSYLLPHSDYVALRESAEVWCCVPFGHFMEALGERFRWLDEYTAVVRAPEQGPWNELCRQLAPAAVARIPHEPQLLKTTQDLLAEYMASTAPVA